MSKKLISMCDYVLNTIDTESIDSFEKLITIAKYAEFLKRPLELGMFIPVDGLGNMILPNTNTCQYDFEVEQQALDRVIFEGFEVIEVATVKSICYEKIVHVFWYDSISLTWNLSNGLTTIESLVPYNLNLK